MALSVRIFQVPNRSASAPKKGWPMPQARFCKAMAKPKVVRSHPVSASSGSWKNPMAERGPKVITVTRQPQITSSQGRGALRNEVEDKGAIPLQQRVAEAPDNGGNSTGAEFH